MFMTKEIVVRIPGEPIAQGRPRFSTHGGLLEHMTQRKVKMQSNQLDSLLQMLWKNKTSTF